MNNSFQQTDQSKARVLDSISRSTSGYHKGLVYSLVAIPVGYSSMISLAPMKPITKDSIGIGTQLIRVIWEETFWRLMDWKNPHPKPGMYKMMLDHLEHKKPHTIWIDKAGRISAIISDEEVTEQMNTLYPLQVLQYIQQEFSSKDPKRVIDISKRLEAEAKLKQFTGSNE